MTIGTTGTDLSSTVADGTTTPVITLQVPSASATNRGALTSTDWSTFNNKQANLVSGSNIKTINNTSLLGSGNITIASGGGPGTGTVGKLPYWDTTTTLADSILSQTAGVPNVLAVDGSLELSSLYGLKFGAAGDAFNAYEEGVWTPTAYAPVGSAPTSANGAGTYTKIGDVVHITFTIDITSYSSLNVAMLIQGLPFNGLNGGASESSTISLSTNNGPFLQQRPTVGTLLGSSITMKRFTDMANNDNSLTDSILSQTAGVPNVLAVDGSLELSSLYGLKFGAAGDAFNAYEEGVWTPTAYAPVGSAPTSANGAGTYTKIGDVVHITFTIDITSYSSLNVAMLIQGLPFNGLNGGASESSTISLSTNNGPFLQQRPTVGTLLGSSITMKRFTDMANNDNSLTDASWFAQAAFTNYTLTGSGTYKVA